MSDKTVEAWVDAKHGLHRIIHQYEEGEMVGAKIESCGYRDVLIEAVEILKRWRSTVVNPEEKKHCEYPNCLICDTLAWLEGLGDERT